MFPRALRVDQSCIHLRVSLKMHMTCEEGHKRFNHLCPLSAETLTNVLDFKRDAGLWHGVLTVSVVC